MPAERKMVVHVVVVPVVVVGVVVVVPESAEIYYILSQPLLLVYFGHVCVLKLLQKVTGVMFKMTVFAILSKTFTAVVPVVVEPVVVVGVVVVVPEIRDVY